MYNPTIFYKGKLCELQLDYYTDTGNKSIRLIDILDGSAVAKATTNVEGVKLPANEVMIKDYTENEGMLKALQNSEVVGQTLYTVHSGFEDIPVVTLSEPLMERFKNEKHDRFMTTMNKQYVTGLENDNEM